MCKNWVDCLFFILISDIIDERKDDVINFFQKSKAAESFPLRLSCSDLNKPFKNSSIWDAWINTLQELVRYLKYSNISPVVEKSTTALVNLHPAV